MDDDKEIVVIENNSSLEDRSWMVHNKNEASRLAAFLVSNNIPAKAYSMKEWDVLNGQK